MQKITKAVIAAAGFGTRFLPQTKAMPKEMLPIVDKPVIQYVVEELVESGIKDIVIVTGWHKRSIEDHFDYPYELITLLEEQKKAKLLEEVKRSASLANFVYIRQKGPYGNGTPFYCARQVIDNEPFVAMFGDEFITANPPRVKQCIDTFRKYGDPVLSAVRVKDVTKVGVIGGTEVEKNIWQIKKYIEKPTREEAPSNLGVVGCYVLTPDIFSALGGLEPGKGNEIWLVDAINKLMKKRPVYACEVQNAHYYDTGNKLDYIKTVVAHAMKHPEIGSDFKKYLKGLRI